MLLPRLLKEMQKEKKEKKQREAQEAKEKGEPLVSPSLATRQTGSSTLTGFSASSASEQSESEADEAKPKKVKVSELFCRQVPNILILLSSYLFVAVCSLLRGGHGVESVVKLDSCSDYSWAILGFSQLGLILMMLFGNKSNQRALAYHPSLEPIIKARTEKIKLPVNVKIVLVSFISGILAGTLGVGGGMIINPLLMQIGFDPQTATTLSKLSTFFSASATVCQYAIAGSISLRHTYHLGFLGMCGSLTGNLILAKLVAKYKRPSIVIWALLLTLGLSMVVYPVHLYHSVDKTNWKSVLEWGSVCYPS